MKFFDLFQDHARSRIELLTRVCRTHTQEGKWVEYARRIETRSIINLNGIVYEIIEIWDARRETQDGETNETI